MFFPHEQTTDTPKLILFHKSFKMSSSRANIYISVHSIPSTVQVNIIITLSLVSVETDCDLSETVLL